MTWQERLDEITGERYKNYAYAFEEAVKLFRELIAELEETNGALHDAVKLVAKLSDDRDRLRKRDEVMRVYVEKGLELEDKYQPDTTWSQEARVLSDILAALDKQEDTDERKD